MSEGRVKAEDPNSLVEIAQATGASRWLTALPIAEHGFALNFVMCSTCGMGGDNHFYHNSKFVTVEHALSCPYGGFPTIRHNEVRNITAHLMSDVCHSVGNLTTHH